MKKIIVRITKNGQKTEVETRTKERILISTQWNGLHYETSIFIIEGDRIQRLEIIGIYTSLDRAITDHVSLVEKWRNETRLISHIREEMRRA